MQRGGLAKRSHSVSERWETTVDPARGGVHGLLSRKSHPVGCPCLPMVWRPGRGDRPRSGDPDKNLGAMGVGFPSSQSRGMGQERPAQLVYQQMAAPETRTLRHIEAVSSTRPSRCRATRRRQARRSDCSKSTPRLGPARCCRAQRRRNCGRDRCQGRHCTVMALALTRDTTKPADRRYLGGA